MEIVSPNLETTTSTLKPQQPVPASFAPGTTSGTDKRKVPESFSTPKGYGKEAWNKEWDQYQAWREKQQRSLDSSTNYIRNLKEQLAQIQVQLSEAKATGNTAKAAEMRDLAEVCLAAIPQEQALVADLTKQIAVADAWWIEHSTFPPKQTKQDSLEDRVRTYQNHLKAQQMGLAGIDKLIHEQQALLADVELVLAAAVAADPSTADIVAPDDASIARRTAADIRRMLETLHNERRLLVEGMAEALDAHHADMARLDAEPESFAGVYSVTTEATVEELASRVVSAIQQATRAISESTKYPPGSALWVAWYSPDIFTLHSALVTGWTKNRDASQSPVLYPAPEPLHADTVAVVLPDGGVFNEERGYFDSIAAYYTYIDTFNSNEVEQGRLEAEPYQAEALTTDSNDWNNAAHQVGIADGALRTDTKETQP